MMDSRAPDPNTSTNVDEARPRNVSLEDIKGPILHRLEGRLTAAEHTLSVKLEENAGLKEYIELMNQECLELHAKLFDEANKQVEAALCEQDRAQRLSNETRAENEVLRGEMNALKLLLLNSTPSSPNRHLHPQLSPDPHKKVRSKGRESFFTSFSRKASLDVHSDDSGSSLKRSTSHHEITKEPSDSTAVTITVEPRQFEEFTNWLDAGCLIESPADELPNQISSSTLPTTFLHRVTHDDVIPCLSFICQTTTQLILRALPTIEFDLDPIKLSTVSIDDDVSNKSCPLVASLPVKYRLKFKTKNDTTKEPAMCVYISELARRRIVSACNFYQYLGFVARGFIVQASREDMFRVVQDHRKCMSLSRLGYPLPSQ